MCGTWRGKKEEEEKKENILKIKKRRKRCSNETEQQQLHPPTLILGIDPWPQGRPLVCQWQLQPSERKKEKKIS